MNVRKFKLEDAEETLRVYMQLSNLKIDPFTKKGIKRNTELVKDAGFINEDNVILVAEENGEILGMTVLEHKGNTMSIKPKKGMFRILFKYGFFTVMNLLKMANALSHKFSEGELYIESIVVDKDARGKGVGKELFKGY